MFAPAAEVAPEPVEASRGDREARQTGQPPVQPGDLRRSRPPQNRGNDQHAAGMSQGGDEAEQRGLVPPRPGSQGDRGHEGLAVSRLNRVNGTETRGDQQDRQPGGPRATVEQSREPLGGFRWASRGVLARRLRDLCQPRLPGSLFRSTLGSAGRGASPGHETQPRPCGSAVLPRR